MRVVTHYVPGRGWRYSVIVRGMQVTAGFYETRELAEEAGRRELEQEKEEARR